MNFSPAEELNDVQELRLRLQEAQEALRAIQSGEVDALLVSRADGPSVFTLQGAEQSYRILVEAMNEGAVTVAQDGTIFYCNTAFAKLVGLPLDSLIGSSLSVLVAPQDRPMFHTLLNENTLDGFKIGLAIARPDAFKVPVQISASLLPQSPVPIFSLVVTDLTDRQRIETVLEEARAQLEIKVKERTAELKLRQQELASLTDNSPDIITRFDREFRHLYVNSAVFQATGKRPEEFIGKTHAEVGIPPGLCQFWQTHLLKVFQSGEPTTLEFTFPTPQGDRFYKARLIPERDAEGSVITLLSIVTDETEQKVAKADLQTSEATLRNFYDSAPVLMGIIELTETNIRHVYDNPAACAFFGVPAESTRGKLATELNLPSNMISTWREYYERSLKMNKPVRFEFFTRNAGKEHWLGVAVAPITGKNRRLSYVAEDITDQKLSEFALKISEDRLSEVNKTLEKRVEERTHELEQANSVIRASLQEKEVLLKEVHHRVKNNLQIISSLLRLQLSRLHDPQSDVILQESQNRIRSMAMIHEQLYQTRDMSNINFKDYLYTLMLHLSQSYSDSHQNISYHLDIDPIQLDLDTAIPCALMATELVSNAFKHAFPQSTAGQLNIGFKRAGSDQVALSVEDNGVGMPAGYDYENSDSLGFTILNALRRQIHGKLTACSGSGGRTRFTITFPIVVVKNTLPQVSERKDLDNPK